MLTSTFVQYSVDALFHTLSSLENEEVAHGEMLSRLFVTLTRRRYETSLHSQRVSRLVMVLARHLHLSDNETALVMLAALLHDIGKLTLPTRLLEKSGLLTSEEWALMHTHPERGHQMLLPIGKIGKKLAPLVIAHHERWDGNGYPYGLRGDTIPQGARLLAVADAYDAMNSARPYRRPLTVREVREEFQRGIARQFDPEICSVLLHILDKEPDMLVSSLAKRGHYTKDKIDAQTGCSITTLFECV